MMTNELINAKVEEIRKINESINLLNAQKAQLEQELKDECDARRAEEIVTALHKIIYNCYERSGVDTDRLRQDGLYDKYKKTSVCTQFKITDIKSA